LFRSARDDDDDDDLSLPPSAVVDSRIGDEVDSEMSVGCGRKMNAKLNVSTGC